MKIVATYAPMKRGLKADTARVHRDIPQVATYAPMKRGLKVSTGLSVLFICLVATYAPMKRGLKVLNAQTLHSQQTGSNLYPDEKGTERPYRGFSTRA